MTIPFLQYFKKKSGRESSAFATALAPVPALVEKPESERMSKTVTPNATRTVGLQEAVGTLAPPTARTARHAISFGGQNTGGRSFDLPPAVALALEPRVERTISLELQDVVSQMPAGMVRPLENANATRHVLLKASEVERGMASGKPSVSVWTIFQQVPEIFLRKIPSDDATEVVLPFQKVMAQFSKLQVRADQSREQAVPHLETPFLKVTLEDDARFGTVTQIPQPQAGELPPGRMEPATAATLAAAEPEATASERFVVTALPPMHFPEPAQPNGNESGAGNSARLVPSAPKPAGSVPFRLSPKGADAPASERVPASSGPSVPTSAPTRIPFKITAPSEEVRPKEPWLTKENFAGDQTSPKAAGAPAALADEVKIALPLKPILQGLLPEQLTGELTTMPDDVAVEIPFCLIEPQLASGRVSLPPAEFAHHLPEKYRDLFGAAVVDAPVVLPLKDVLKNLPGASLRVRTDQVEQEVGENIETPFSARAEEDSKRFQTPLAPIPKVAAPARTPARQAAPLPTAKAATAAVPKPAAAPVKRTGETLDAKVAVARVADIKGVRGCAIMFGDGLALAGNLPAKYAADGLCAMAPAFFRKIENHLTETTLGLLETMTLTCENDSLTFLVHDNLCLVAVHDKPGLPSEIRDRLARVLLELSRKYSHPA